jgi:hypothetical protein
MTNETFEKWLGSVQLWQIGLIILAALLIAATVGYAAQRWRQARKKKEPYENQEDSHEGQEGYLVSAVLGLLALLLGFTFSLAVDRFDARRVFVLDEANAIGTAYLRTQLLEAPHRERLSRLLVAYTDNRLALAHAREPVPADLLKANNQLITQLWQATVAAFPSIKDYDFSSSYLESMNTVIDLDTSRKAARRAHVPGSVFLVLSIYAIGTAAVLGYVLIGIRGRISAAAVMMLFTLAFLLIIDIDRPTLGTVRESQAPMEWLRNSLQSWQPPVFDQPPP